MQTRSATKCLRPPDASVQPRRCQQPKLRTPPGEAPAALGQDPMVSNAGVPATAVVARRCAAARGTRGWTVLRSQLSDAIHQVRILLFVHIEDVKKCFWTRFRLQYLSRRLRLRALARVIHGTPFATDDGVTAALAQYDTCNDERLEGVLVMRTYWWCWSGWH
jgi:hypothetical protein